jgi:hypothetical protein
VGALKLGVLPPKIGKVDMSVAYIKKQDNEDVGI